MTHLSDPVRRDLTHAQPAAAPPGVDVVVPTTPGAAGLQRCLRGLASQTVKPASVQVVEDAAGRGPAWARNEGWRRGRAPIVAFTQDDCVPHPDWVKRIQGDFRDTRVDALEGSQLRRDAAGALHPADPPPWVASDRFRAANVAYRRVLLENLHGFDERYPGGRDDVDLAWRALARGVKVHWAPEVKVLVADRLPRPPGPDGEIRLYRLDPERYAEVAAGALREGADPLARKAIRAALKGKPRAADLKPLSLAEDLKLWSAAAAQLMRWRLTKGLEPGERPG